MIQVRVTHNHPTNSSKTVSFCATAISSENADLLRDLVHKKTQVRLLLFLRVYVSLGPEIPPVTQKEEE